jgi:hypothetical protein
MRPAGQQMQLLKLRQYVSVRTLLTSVAWFPAVKHWLLCLRSCIQRPGKHTVVQHVLLSLL